MSDVVWVPGPTPRFAPGDRVRIDDRDPPVHHRTPRYVRGKVGVIERIAGAYGEPELLAYGDADAPWRVLYRVHLRQCDLWPDQGGSSVDRGNTVAASDTLEVEIFEHWLEPAP